MSDYELNELSAAISLMLESLRPGSMQVRVLESMVNKAPNGLPRMTYDLDVANQKLAMTMEDLQVPSIWELIGLDVAPYPGLWQRMEYARDNWKSIRTAVYNLKEQFESLGNYQDEDGNIFADPISLFVFNKNGPDSRDINVVTPIRTYCNAAELCRGKAQKGITSRVVKLTSRARINGQSVSALIKEVATVLNDSRKSASLGSGLADEMKRLEGGQ